MDFSGTVIEETKRYLEEVLVGMSFIGVKIPASTGFPEQKIDLFVCRQELEVGHCFDILPSEPILIKGDELSRMSIGGIYANTHAEAVLKFLSELDR